MLLQDLAGGLHPVEAGHPQVHQHDLRPVTAHQGHGLLAVGGGADDLHPGQDAQRGH